MLTQMSLDTSVVHSAKVETVTSFKVSLEPLVVYRNEFEHCHHKNCFRERQHTNKVLPIHVGALSLGFSASSHP